MYTAVCDSVQQSLRHEEVIQSTSPDSLAIHKCTSLFIRVEVAVCIHKACFQNSRNTAALLLCKAGDMHSLFAAFQISSIVCCIQITAQNNRLFSIEAFYQGEQCGVPFHAFFKAGEIRRCIGCIAVNEIERPKVCCDHAAFAVEGFKPNAAINFCRFLQCQQGSSGIAFTLSIIPVLLVSGNIQTALAGLQTGFLQAVYVSVKDSKGLQKGLVHA